MNWQRRWFLVCLTAGSGGICSSDDARWLFLRPPLLWAQSVPVQSPEAVLREENQDLRARVQKLSADLVERDRTLTHEREEKASLSRQLDAVRRERNSAERERHEARLRANSLADELKHQEERLRAREQEVSNRRIAVEEELARTQGRVEGFETNLAQKGTSSTKTSPSEMAGHEKHVPAPGADPALNGEEMQRELDVERERRATLEQELKRLTAESNAQAELQALNHSLQDSRAQILVLSNRLADERRERESLEVVMERISKAAGIEKGSGPDAWSRLVRAMESRRAEADRLAVELRNANEAIVRLKGQLEASRSPEENQRILAELQTENQKLRTALSSAEKVNQSLQSKAELAERLADMLYSGR